MNISDISTSRVIPLFGFILIYVVRFFSVLYFILKGDTVIGLVSSANGILVRVFVVLAFIWLKFLCTPTIFCFAMYVLGRVGKGTCQKFKRIMHC